MFKLQILTFIFLIGCMSASYAQELKMSDGNIKSLNIITEVPEQKSTAQNIFMRAKKVVYQIKVINKQSGQKATIGSGFKIEPDGFFVTNYHVISDVALYPDNFTLEYLSSDNKKAALKIRNIDVINDLAILEPVVEDRDSKDHILFRYKKLEKGASIFSIGNPHDLGMTIVNGVYNGLLENSLYQKILFSGAINAGMSGGPALDELGQLIGVNVAASGDDLGYLVPAKFVHILLAKKLPKKEWKKVIRDQLISNSENVIAELTSKNWETKTLGNFQIPDNLDKTFKCWGDGHNESDKDNYSYAAFSCETEDSIYVSSRLDTGMISYNVINISSDILNPLAFSGYYKDQYKYISAYTSFKDEKDVGEFECQSEFVEISQQKWKVAMCARPYLKYKGLYDVFVKAALMGKEKEGYLFEIFLDGFSKKSSEDFIKKFMETMK